MSNADPMYVKIVGTVAACAIAGGAQMLLKMGPAYVLCMSAAGYLIAAMWHPTPGYVKALPAPAPEPAPEKPEGT